MTLEFVTESPEQTLALGGIIGEAAEPGLLVALQGDLGAGKTLITKGIARGLGVDRPEYVTSPTFPIHNQYRGRLELHHLDLYRLGDDAELEDLGLEEVLGGTGVCVIEWPDRFFESLESDRMEIHFEVVGSERRKLTLVCRGILASRVGERVRLRWGKREDSHDV